MKPLVMAMGIEEGKVTPLSEFVDTGSVSEAGYTIRNSEDKVYGRSTMTEVLNQSINTGIIYVEKLLGNKTFGDYFTRFGFGERTGIDLPAELAGNTKNLSNARSTISFFTAAFGQGVTTTPLQPERVRQVVSVETSQTMGQMLRDVVVNGHGKRADVPGYQVGGKTGTAQVAKNDARGYQAGVSIGSFIGYAPLDDPRFVVLVKLDNPKNVEWAESSAAPTFGEIMKFLLGYAKIKPTEATKP